MRPLLIIVVAAVLAVPRAEASYQGALRQKVTYTATVTNDGGNSDALGVTVLEFSKRSKIVSAQVLTFAKGETRQFDLQVEHRQGGLRARCTSRNTECAGRVHPDPRDHHHLQHDHHRQRHAPDLGCGTVS